jgi:hypothetical protein
VAPLGDAQDPRRPRLLLPRPGRRRLPYANICEQCDNFVTTTEFLPALENQLTDMRALRDDAQARGWHTEVARHARVIADIEGHLRRLKQQADTATLA